MKTVNVRIKYGGQVMTYGCGDFSPVLGDWVVVKAGDLTYLGQVVTMPMIFASRSKFHGSPGSAEQAVKPPPSSEAGSANGPGRIGKRADAHSAVSRSETTELSALAADGDRAADQEPPAPPAQGPDGCPASPEFRHMLRLATQADLARQAENEIREREAFEYCLSRVHIQRLDMKLVAVEVVFDGSKTIFYYTADERVDFRLLVKELVSRFRTRIEMRQIGVRHEARMVGGLGGCGRSFCCCGFLSNFAPVSVKMAKEQSVSLSPSKISGVCGRLMCCLAFEHLGPVGKRSKTQGAGDDLSPSLEMPIPG